MTPRSGGPGLLAAGAASSGARLFAQSADFGLRHHVEAADLPAAHLAGVDQLPKPLGTVARVAGRFGNQDQFLVSHGATISRLANIIPLALLAVTNYNIGVEQYSEEVPPPSTRIAVPPGPCRPFD